MSVLSEKAEKGTARSLENIYISQRGRLRWIWSILSGGSEIGGEQERNIWRSFYSAVAEGRLKAGDRIERYLAAAAAAEMLGRDSGFRISGSEQDPDAGMIKFPGDADSGKNYLEQLMASLDTEGRAAALLRAFGLTAAEAGRILGLSADDAAKAMAASAASLKEAGRAAAGNRYNINIPAPEMFADLIERAPVPDDGSPADSEIISYVSDAASKKAAAPAKDTYRDTGGKKKVPAWAAALMILLLAVAAFAGTYAYVKWKNSEGSGGVGTYDGPISGDNQQDEVLVINYHVVMEIENYGTIELELDSSAAPRTVNNFVTLVKRGFYDGLTFHRIIDGFMIQGGDPQGDGTGGSDKKIIGEFKANGVDNPISHKRGVISMARSSNDYNSARSQFFIVQKDSTYLDGNYAAFGYVTSGMDVVDKIAADAKPIDDNGKIAKEDQPVILSVTVTAEEE